MPATPRPPGVPIDALARCARIGSAMTAPTRSRTSTPPRRAGAAAAPPLADLHDPVIDWFDEHARDLPWRRPEAGRLGR